MRAVFLDFGIVNEPNLIVTPCVAWASHQARQGIIESVAAHVEAFPGGKPVNLV